jgi:sialidase-1
MQTILDYDAGESDSRGNGVGDPAILVDGRTGTIFVAALWSRGDRGWHGSGPGLTPQETGQFVITSSSDDGLTWSEPLNITAQVKEPASRASLPAPRPPLQARDGTLIFAAQYREANGMAHSCFVYSRDQGESWTISPPAIAAGPPTSESQVAELDDGSLLLSMRDESRSGERLWARWTWASDQSSAESGEWSESWKTVPDPTCMASLIRHPDGRLLFSNPNHPRQRVALTVRSSADQGRTWSEGRLLDPRGCMYSCMTVLRDGRVGILYEVDGTLTFARFPVSWLDTSGPKGSR